MSHLKDLLSYVPAYIAFQRAIGADRLRYRCVEELDLEPGDTVLDIGCGPAYYFERLPHPLTYYGFDTEPRYIEWARRKWGNRAEFHLGAFDAIRAAEIRPPDAILLLGLLHHLSDAESDALLALCGRVLAPNGKVVALDTAFEPSQGRISRWMSENDRGEYVREPEAFVELARPHFGTVDGVVLSDVTRVPGSYWMMKMRGPVATH